MWSSYEDEITVFRSWVYANHPVPHPTVQSRLIFYVRSMIFLAAYLVHLANFNMLLYQKREQVFALFLSLQPIFLIDDSF